MYSVIREYFAAKKATILPNFLPLLPTDSDMKLAAIAFVATNSHYSSMKHCFGLPVFMGTFIPRSLIGPRMISKTFVSCLQSSLGPIGSYFSWKMDSFCVRSIGHKSRNCSPAGSTGSSRSVSGGSQEVWVKAGRRHTGAQPNFRAPS